MEAGITLMGAPIYTLAKFSGMKRSPARLRELGLLRALQACRLEVREAGDAELQGPLRDEGPEKIRNLSSYIRDTRLLTSQLSRAYRGGFLLLLGGECSLILGSLNALGSLFKGRPGLLWLDAHGDYNTPDTSPSGYIGGMCLAFACGRGAVYVKEILQVPPLDEGCVVHIGSRALDEMERLALLSSKLKLYTSDHVKVMGAKKVAREARRILEGRADWLIVHLDLDVLDPKAISPTNPAVNYPEAGGLSPSEVSLIAREVMSTGKARALHLTAYNAALDKDGSSGRNIIALVAELLRQA